MGPQRGWEGGGPAGMLSFLRICLSGENLSPRFLLPLSPSLLPNQIESSGRIINDSDNAAEFREMTVIWF